MGVEAFIDNQKADAVQLTLQKGIWRIALFVSGKEQQITIIIITSHQLADQLGHTCCNLTIARRDAAANAYLDILRIDEGRHDWVD